MDATQYTPVPEPTRLPPHPSVGGPVSIVPATAEVSVIAGQSATMTFTVLAPAGGASLSLGPLPAGITGSVIPRAGSNVSRNYQVILTAAPDMLPVSGNVALTASGLGQQGHATIALNASATATLKPSYMVLTVLYAPPGTNGGKSSSQVSYTAGSTTGTTVSVTSAFKSTVKVKVGLEVGSGVVTLGVNAGFSGSTGSSGTQSMTISKTAANEIDVPGRPRTASITTTTYSTYGSTRK